MMMGVKTNRGPISTRVRPSVEGGAEVEGLEVGGAGVDVEVEVGRAFLVDVSVS